MYERMSNDDRDRFDKLHCQIQDQRLLSIVATNAFGTDEVDDDQQTRVTLRVYNKMCRANHSCQPNAMYSYNHQTGCGSLHALQAIGRNQEINIEYLLGEQ